MRGADIKKKIHHQRDPELEIKLGTVAGILVLGFLLAWVLTQEIHSINFLGITDPSTAAGTQFGIDILNDQVPEAAAMFLFGSGLVGLMACLKKRLKKS